MLIWTSRAVVPISLDYALIFFKNITLPFCKHRATAVTVSPSFYHDVTHTAEICPNWHWGAAYYSICPTGYKWEKVGSSSSCLETYFYKYKNVTTFLIYIGMYDLPIPIKIARNRPIYRSYHCPKHQRLNRKYVSAILSRWTSSLPRQYKQAGVTCTLQLINRPYLFWLNVIWMLLINKVESRDFVMLAYINFPVQYCMYPLNIHINYT